MPNLRDQVTTLRRDAGLKDERIAELEREVARFTDDACYGRCDNPEGMLHWFQHETRGLLGHEEAHEVLDMLLNKLATR